MDIFDLVVSAQKQHIQSPADLSITCFGKKGHGNRILRMHYRQNHLVMKCTQRGDLNKNPEVMAEYIQVIEATQWYPWVVLKDQAFVDLKTLPTIAEIQPKEHLTYPVCNDQVRCSLQTGQVLWETLAEVPRENAYLRQWKAANGGVGIELILLTSGEAGREIHEFYMNYYAKPEMEKVVESVSYKLAHHAS